MENDVSTAESQPIIQWVVSARNPAVMTVILKIIMMKVKIFHAGTAALRSLTKYLSSKNEWDRKISDDGRSL
jgi:hypothetical protein